MTDEHARAPGAHALTVDGLAVAAPLTVGQAQTLARHGLLADDRPSLQRVWDRIVSLWADEVTSARSDATPGLDAVLEARRSAFQVVVAEEWFPLGFARRDLNPLRL